MKFKQEIKKVEAEGKHFIKLATLDSSTEWLELTHGEFSRVRRVVLGMREMDKPKQPRYQVYLDDGEQFECLGKTDWCRTQAVHHKEQYCEAYPGKEAFLVKVKQ